MTLQTRATSPDTTYADNGQTALSRQICVVVMLVVFFSAMRFFGISSFGLSMDESFTRLFGLQAWGQISALVVENDMHPPLYFAITKVFMTFDDQELGVRFSAWLFGSLTLVPVYLSGRIAAGHRVGVMALIIAGLSATLLDISQFARSYSPMTCAVACGLVTLAWMARHPDQAARPVWSSRRSGGMFLLAALSVAVLPWLHNIGAVYGLALGISAVLIWTVSPGRPAAALINVLIAGLVAFVLFAPHFVDLLHQHQDVASGFWVPEVSLSGVSKDVLSVFGAGPWPGKLTELGYALGALLLAFGAFGAVRLIVRRDWALLMLTVAIPLSAMSIFIGYSLKFEPIFMVRLLYPALPPWILLLAITANGLLRSKLGWAATLGAGLIVATGPFLYFATLKEAIDWRGIYHTMQLRSPGVPTLLVVPNSAAVLAGYHAQKLDNPVVIVPAEGAYPAIEDGAVYPTGWQGVPELTEKGLAQFDAAIAEAEGDVWLFLRSHWSYDPHNSLKSHLDRKFCYKLLKIPTEPFAYFVKLVPLSEAAQQGCERLNEIDAFPYMARRDGHIAIEQPRE